MSKLNKIPKDWDQFGFGAALDDLEQASRPLRAYTFGRFVGKMMIMLNVDEDEACKVVLNKLDSVTKAWFGDVLWEDTSE